LSFLAIRAPLQSFSVVVGDGSFSQIEPAASR
jgi:hypothetical protein